ncbi:molybdopterin molybdotransferase MoeA [Pedobacter endophyticus]|uniref:Molybdopterin molybdenumtransferase n=1 Tax=Pedobacter endophyticus TaxID=2789740 RepID=A0A7S9L1D5_9SPHI|nr:gephyrin-like molybdotransferase Glp [Pedobacter endophyticus]QPH40697.1 molybdopterin molybdotransferase MoeA [Pedobacter endophyticus]
MITVNEAKQLVENNVLPLPLKRVPIAEAAGRTLASNVYAICHIPAFAQSSMDGYALKFSDKDQPLDVNGEMAAGTAVKIKINSGETARIFTGAPLPDGADTVVMQEKVTIIGNKIKIEDEKLTQGSNVRNMGAEIKAGELAMEAGSFLSPAAIGFLAGIGIAEVDVFPAPKLAIIVTGKELQTPGKDLAFGQVYESNSFSLTAALKNEGINEIEVFSADDDLQALQNVLEKALAANDVVLLTGGVSVGDYDFVLEASALCNVKQIFHKVKQKPGKPLFFGTKDGKVVFGLPGNPSSVLNCYYNYVVPALKLLSQQESKITEIEATLAADYEKPAGLTHFLKATYTRGLATPLTAQESFRLSSFAQANCLIILEQDRSHFKKGESIKVVLIN